MPHIKYSIIIPTRNGLQYLKYALQTVLSQSFTNFELIISDNHSKDGTSQYVKSLADNRVRYIIPQMELGMSEHFDFALSHANGDWVMMIGDDDGIMPYFFELVESLTSTFSSYEIISSRRAYYYWEGLENEYKNVVFSYFASNNTKEIKTRASFIKILYSYENYFNFPQFYGGTIFKRSFYLNLKNRFNDKVFHSITPDAFSCCLILKNLSSFIHCDIPLAWVGSSKKSTGFSQYSNLEHQKERSIDFLKLYTNKVTKIHGRFSNVMSAKDLNLQFLESYFTMTHIINKKYSENGFFHYLKFLKSYENYRSVSNNDKLRKVAFEEIFRLNNIKLSVIKYMLPYLYIVRCKAFIDNVILFFMKRFFVPIYIKTTDRQKFSDITKANDFIYNLWKDKKLMGL